MTLTAVAIVATLALAGVARAAPAIDQNQGTWFDTYTDPFGLAPSSSGLTDGVVQDAVGGRLVLEAGRSTGVFATSLVTPVSFSAWGRLQVDRSVPTTTSVRLWVLDPATDTLYGQGGATGTRASPPAPLTLSASADPSLREEASLAFLPASVKSIRLYGELAAGEMLRPAVNALRVTWTPRSALQVGLANAASGDVQAGANATFKVNVAVSYVDASDLVVTLPLPQALANPKSQDQRLSLAEASDGGTLSADGQSVVWRLGQRKAGQTFSLRVSLRTLVGLVDGTTYEGQAQASAGNASAVSSQAVRFTVRSAPQLELGRSVSNLYLINGAPFAFASSVHEASLWVQNRGGANETLFDGVVTEDVRALLNPLSSGSSAIVPASLVIGHGGRLATGATTLASGFVVPAGHLYWELAPLPPGEGRSLTYSYTLRAEGPIPTGTELATCHALRSAWAPQGSKASGAAGPSCSAYRVPVPSTPGGTFALGEDVRGNRGLSGGEDLGGTKAGFGEAVTYLFYAGNSAVSELDDVVMIGKVPAGTTFASAFLSATARGSVHYYVELDGEAAPPESPPSFDQASGALGAGWTTTPPTDPAVVSWVAFRVPKLASAYFPREGVPTSALGELVVTVDPPAAACPTGDVTTTAHATFLAYGFTPQQGAPQRITPGPLGNREAEVTRVAPDLPNLPSSLSVSPSATSPGGQINVQLSIPNVPPSGATIPLDDALGLTARLQIPTVMANGVPTHLRLVGLEAPGATITWELPGAVSLAWAQPLPPYQTRTVSLTLSAPAGILSSATAQIAASVAARDDLCGAVASAPAATVSFSGTPSLQVAVDGDYGYGNKGTKVRYAVRYLDSALTPATGTWIVDKPSPGIELRRLQVPKNGEVWVTTRRPGDGVPAQLGAAEPFSEALIRGAFTRLADTDGDGFVEPPAPPTYVAWRVDDNTLTPPQLVTQAARSLEVEAVITEDEEGAVVTNQVAILSSELLQAVGTPAEFLVTPRPGLRLTLACTEIAASLESVTLTMPFYNDSANASTSTTLAVTLPEGISPTSARVEWNRTYLGNHPGAGSPTIPLGGTITADLGALGPLEGGTLIVVGRVDGFVESGTWLASEVLGTALAGEATTIAYDACNTLVENADLEVRVLADNANPRAGEALGYTLFVANRGAHDAAELLLAATLPAGLSIVAGTTFVTPFPWQLTPGAEPSVMGGELVWSEATGQALTLGDGEPGLLAGLSGDVAIRFQARVGEAVLPGTELEVCGRAATATGDDGRFPNEACVTVTTPLPDPAVAITGPSVRAIDARAVYTLSYGNEANETAPGVVVIASLPDGPSPPADGVPDLTYTSHLANNGEVVWFYQGSAGTTPAFDRTDPARSGWVRSPVAGRPVSHVAFVAGRLDPLTPPRSVQLALAVSSPAGQAILPGSAFTTCAEVSMRSGVNELRADNNRGCATTRVPGIDLALHASCDPSGANPGLLPGGRFEATLEIENSGVERAHGLGVELTLSEGATLAGGPEPLAEIVDGDGQPSAAIDALGNRIERAVPWTRVGGRVVLGTLEQGSPLWYRRVGLRSGDRARMKVLVATSSEVANKTAIDADGRLVVDYVEGFDPTTSEGEEIVDNNADRCGVMVFRADVLAKKDVVNATTGSTSVADVGDVLDWQLSYNNIGDFEAEQVVLEDAVPEGLAVIVGAFGGVDSQTVEVSYSKDGGMSFGPIDTPPGRADPDITHVRFTWREGMSAPVGGLFVQTTATDFARGTHRGTAVDPVANGVLAVGGKACDGVTCGVVSCPSGTYVPEGGCCPACRPTPVPACGEGGELDTSSCNYTLDNAWTGCWDSTHCGLTCTPPAPSDGGGGDVFAAPVLVDPRVELCGQAYGGDVYNTDPSTWQGWVDSWASCIGKNDPATCDGLRCGKKEGESCPDTPLWELCWTAECPAAATFDCATTSYLDACYRAYSWALAGYARCVAARGEAACAWARPVETCGGCWESSCEATPEALRSWAKLPTWTLSRYLDPIVRQHVVGTLIPAGVETASLMPTLLQGECRPPVACGAGVTLQCVRPCMEGNCQDCGNGLQCWLCPGDSDFEKSEVDLQGALLKPKEPPQVITDGYCTQVRDLLSVRWQECLAMADKNGLGAATCDWTKPPTCDPGPECAVSSYTSPAFPDEAGGVLAWKKLLVEDSVRVADANIRYSVLDAETMKPVAGFEDVPSPEGGFLDLSGIDPTEHPRLALRAEFTGQGQSGLFELRGVGGEDRCGVDRGDAQIYPTEINDAGVVTGYSTQLNAIWEAPPSLPIENIDVQPLPLSIAASALPEWSADEQAFWDHYNAVRPNDVRAAEGGYDAALTLAVNKSKDIDAQGVGGANQVAAYGRWRPGEAGPTVVPIVRDAQGRTSGRTSNAFHVGPTDASGVVRVIGRVEPEQLVYGNSFWPFFVFTPSTGAYEELELADLGLTTEPGEVAFIDRLEVLDASNREWIVQILVYALTPCEGPTLEDCWAQGYYGDALPAYRLNWKESRVYALREGSPPALIGPNAQLADVNEVGMASGYFENGEIWVYFRGALDRPNGALARNHPRLSKHSPDMLGTVINGDASGGSWLYRVYRWNPDGSKSGEWDVWIDPQCSAQDFGPLADGMFVVTGECWDTTPKQVFHWTPRFGMQRLAPPDELAGANFKAGNLVGDQIAYLQFSADKEKEEARTGLRSPAAATDPIDWVPSPCSDCGTGWGYTDIVAASGPSVSTPGFFFFGQTSTDLTHQGPYVATVTAGEDPCQTMPGQAFRWSQERGVEVLPRPNADTFDAVVTTGISNAGLIVGAHGPVDEKKGTTYHAFAWGETTGWIDLEDEVGGQIDGQAISASVALDVNELNQVAGVLVLGGDAAASEQALVLEKQVADLERRLTEMQEKQVELQKKIVMMQRELQDRTAQRTRAQQEYMQRRNAFDEAVQLVAEASALLEAMTGAAAAPSLPGTPTLPEDIVNLLGQAWDLVTEFLLPSWPGDPASLEDAANQLIEAIMANSPGAALDLAQRVDALLQRAQEEDSLREQEAATVFADVRASTLRSIQDAQQQLQALTQELDTMTAELRDLEQQLEAARAAAAFMFKAFVWAEGEGMRVLDRPLRGRGDSPNGFPLVRLNDAGVVTSTTANTGMTFAVLRWQPATDALELLEVYFPESFTGYPLTRAINTRGDVAVLPLGTEGSPTGGSFVWAADGVVHFIAPPEGYSLVHVLDLNDRMEAVGFAQDFDKNQQAFTWGPARGFEPISGGQIAASLTEDGAALVWSSQSGGVAAAGGGLEPQREVSPGALFIVEPDGSRRSVAMPEGTIYSYPNNENLLITSSRLTPGRVALWQVRVDRADVTGTYPFVWKPASAEDLGLLGWRVDYRTATDPAVTLSTEVGDVCADTIENRVEIGTETPQVSRDNDRASASIRMNRADLEVEIELDRVVAQAYDPINATITWRNLGPGDAEVVRVALRLPKELAKEEVLLLKDGVLAAGEEGSTDYGFTMPEIPAGESLGLAAYVDAATLDCQPDNDEDGASVIVGSFPNAWVELDAPSSATVGEDFAVELRYGNNGNDVAEAASASLTLPPGVELVSATSEPQQQGQTLTWRATGKGNFDPGQRLSQKLTLRVAGCGIADQRLAFAASVATTSLDIDASDDRAAAETLVLAPAGKIAIALAPSRADAPVGSVVTYALHLANPGDVTVFEPKITLPLDGLTLGPGPLPAGATLKQGVLVWSRPTLPPGAAGAVLVDLVAPSDRRALRLGASATARGACPAEANASPVVIAGPGLHLALASVEASHCPEGDAPLTFRATLTNDGTTPLNDLRLTAEPSPGMAFVPGSVEGPGELSGDTFIEWNVPTLPAGASLSFSFATRPSTRTLIEVPALQQEVRLTSGALEGQPREDVIGELDELRLQPAETGLIARAAVPNRCLPRLAVSHTWGATCAVTGTTHTLDVLVTNPTTNTIDAAAMSEQVPAPFTFVSSTLGTFDATTRRLNAALGTLRPGATCAVRIELALPAGAPAGAIYALESQLVGKDVLPQVGNRLAGGTLACTDGNACTEDACEPALGCVFPNVDDGTACDDGDACTAPDACSSGACGGGAVDCDDGNPCTEDACDREQGCTHTALVDGTACDDGDLCTSADTCRAGECAAGDPVVCGEPGECQAEGVCDPATGDCSFAVLADGTTCDDGDPCTAKDACLGGACVSGTPLPGECRCGDTWIIAGEKCDDGNRQAGDGCSPACTIEPGWRCFGKEPGPDLANPGGLCLRLCGNALIDAGEQCDDGNITDGDGCSASCQVTPGFDCDRPGRVCQTVCGDGIWVYPEHCDDGNRQAGDGCSATCQVETGWECPDELHCKPRCGDGVLAGGQACDDGNTDPDDGCDASCGLEPGWSCPAPGIACVLDARLTLVDDEGETTEDTPIELVVVDNDRGRDLNVTAVGAAAHGHAEVLDGFTVRYTPGPAFVGEDTFTYEAIDADGNTGSASVTVTVVALTGGDFQVARMAQSCTGKTPSYQLDVALVGGSGRFLLGDKPVGPTFRTTSASGTTTDLVIRDASQSPKVTPKTMTGQLTCDPPPKALVAKGDTVTTVDGAGLVDVLGNDEGTGLAIVAIDAPRHGSATAGARPGTLRYVAAEGFSGTDRFLYRVADSSGAEDAAEVVVTVPPGAFDARDDRAATFVGQPVKIAIAKNDLGAGVFAELGSPAHGTATRGADGVVTYTPAADFAGEDSFTYTLTLDGKRDVATARVYVAKPGECVPVEVDELVPTCSTPLPSPANPGTVTVVADLRGASGVFTVNGATRGLQNHTAAAETTAVDAPAEATRIGALRSTADATFTSEPVPSGRPIRVAITDVLSPPTCPAALASVKVDCTDPTPLEAIDDLVETRAMVPVLLRPLANDRGVGLTTSSIGQPANGTLEALGQGVYRYTPEPGFTGTERIAYAARDARAEIDGGVVTIEVRAHDPGVCEGFGARSLTPTCSPDGRTVTWTFDISKGSGVFRVAGDDTTERHVSYPLVSSGAHVSVRVEDLAAPECGAFTVLARHTCAPLALLPQANPDAVSLTPGTTQVFDPLRNDKGVGLVVSNMGRPEKGSISAVPQVGWVYVPPTGFSGLDRATYQIRDLTGRTASAKVYFFVNAPSAVVAGCRTCALNAVDDRITLAVGDVVSRDLLANDLGPQPSLIGYAGYSVNEVELSGSTLKVVGRRVASGERLTYRVRDALGFEDEGVVLIGTSEERPCEANAGTMLGAPPAACGYALEASGYQRAAGYAQGLVVTDLADRVVAFQSGATLTTPLPPGDYRVRALSWRLASQGALPLPGQALAVTVACHALSAPIRYTELAPIAVDLEPTCDGGFYQLDVTALGGEPATGFGAYLTELSAAPPYQPGQVVFVTVSDEAGCMTTEALTLPEAPCGDTP